MVVDERRQRWVNGHNEWGESTVGGGGRREETPLFPLSALISRIDMGGGQFLHPSGGV